MERRASIEMEATAARASPDMKDITVIKVSYCILWGLISAIILNIKCFYSSCS